MIATLHSECSDMFTYRVDGPNVEFLGRGDSHPTADTNTKFERDFHTFDKIFQIPDEERANGECFYMFHVHAALDMKPLYVNNDAVIFAIIIGAVFVFTSLVFIAYDYAVKRNQHKVMQSAMRSGGIVASLFPKNVRDRMYQDTANAETAKQDPDKGAFRASNERTNSIMGGMGGMGTSLVHADSNISNSDPVADLYPNCTVLFVDIAGKLWLIRDFVSFSWWLNITLTLTILSFLIL